LAVEPITPKGHRTRQAILHAARTVFARDGYVEARMSDIAREASLSTGALYRYFPGKEEVFAALISDLHEQLFRSSGGTNHDLADNPYETLLEANRGYLAVYYENRDVMRSFIEAAAVDTRFREIWWRMRQRHIDRFLAAVACAGRARPSPDGKPELLVEAMACMVEQSAYVWFAHEELREVPPTVDDAARTVTGVWYRTFFGEC
jgi:AcrR family transcriptional regulator